LEEKAKKTGVVYFDSESSMSLLEQLKQKMKENVSALVVNNFTELLFSFSKNNDSVGKDALLELNFSRENLYELTDSNSFFG
jgi:hypothetical protein